MRKTRKENLDDIHMNIASMYASMSEDPDRKVGCIIVKDTNIIGIGYNGTLSGADNTIESKGDKSHVVHAEINALAKILRSTSNNLEGAELFCTTLPCLECSKVIYQSGIRKIYFDEYYHRDDRGLALLSTLGVEYTQIKSSKNK